MNDMQDDEEILGDGVFSFVCFLMWEIFIPCFYADGMIH